MKKTSADWGRLWCRLAPPQIRRKVQPRGPTADFPAADRSERASEASTQLCDCARCALFGRGAHSFAGLENRNSFEWK